MDYLVIALGLLATCVAIRGDTWDPTKMLWRRLTIVGWAALIVALSSAGAAVYKVHVERSARAARRQAAEAVFNNFVQAPKRELTTIYIFSSDPGYPKDSKTKAAEIKEQFSKIAIYDEALNAYIDVLDEKEITSILNMSTLLRDSDADGDPNDWSSLGRALDSNLTVLEHSFYNLPKRKYSFCARFDTASHLAIDLFSPAQN